MARSVEELQTSGKGWNEQENTSLDRVSQGEKDCSLEWLGLCKQVETYQHVHHHYLVVVHHLLQVPIPKVRDQHECHHLGLMVDPLAVNKLFVA
jgi:hypothetical protein